MVEEVVNQVVIVMMYIEKEEVENDHLGRTWHHVLLEASVEHGDSRGGSLDRVRLVTCREDGRDCAGEKPKI